MTKPTTPIYQLKRQAKQLARIQDIQHAEALDIIARQHGFSSWSLLAAQPDAPTPSLLSRLSHGDLLLLGARPGHGKTRLGLQMLLDAVSERRRAVFFTLEYTEPQARERIARLDTDGCGSAIEIVTTDDIEAFHIIRHLQDAAPGTVAVIDFLQILDQKRSKPALSEQLADLRRFAQDAGVILAFIAQIDRSFDPQSKPVPDLGDIRLPNPADLGVFSKACFLQGDAVRFEALT
ncbi:MAG: DNA helicase [Candidatus Devosia phytovorans]|uniref:DNA helicase n=1 Tax=Candidatus Devosia phytovorans TaxID=3121372 RepID=A0AAJ5VXP2_9HYPH|nr:DNA helicase [Devosia sp.]WEK06297.1 MAG: DNA helicase [Devosia sp.]